MFGIFGKQPEASTTSFWSNLVVFGKTGYYLFKSADIILSLNKYLVMGFSIYGMYKLLKYFIYNPLREVMKFVRVEMTPLSSLLRTYGKNLIVITGPTTGLGPAYCKKLIQAGFRDFLLIDENLVELEQLKVELNQYYHALNSKQVVASAFKRKQKSTKGEDESFIEPLKLDSFVFDFDDSFETDRFKSLDDKMREVCSTKEISMLINNFAKLHKGSFETMEYKDISEMINGNINAITYMSRFVL